MNPVRFLSILRNRGVRGLSFLYLLPLLPIVFVTIVSDWHWKFWKFTFPLSSSRPFLDLELLTSNIRCHIENPQIPISELSCDPGGRVFNYPEFMIHFASLSKVGNYSNFTLGVFFQILFIGTLGFLLLFYTRESRPNNVKFFLASLASFSPPIFFVLERGNTDSFVFVLTVFGLLLVGAFSLLGFLLLVIAFMLKLYPAAAILVTISKKRIRSVALTISIIVFWFVVNLSDFIRVWKVSPSYQWDSYGLRVPAFQLAEYFKHPLAGRSGLLLSTFFGGICLVVCFSILFYFRNQARLKDWISFDQVSIIRIPDTAEELVAMGSLSVFLGTFFMGMSWDTKLIFLLPFIYWGVLRSKTSGFLTCLCYLILFLSAPIYKPLQTLGDSTVFLLVAYLFYLIFLRINETLITKILPAKQY